jgi:hypothetical protein
MDGEGAGFKSFRAPEGKPEAEKDWLPMRKGISDLHRLGETSQAANDRYLQAMASVEDSTPSRPVDRAVGPTGEAERPARAGAEPACAG